MDYLKEKYKDDTEYIDKIFMVYGEMYKHDVLAIVLRLILSIKRNETEVFSKRERQVIENNSVLINKLNCDVYYV